MLGLKKPQRQKQSERNWKRCWGRTEVRWSTSRFLPPRPLYLFSNVLVLLPMWPSAYQHEPVTQDNSSLRKPPNKHRLIFWTAETSFSPHLSLPSLPPPFPPFHFGGWWCVQSSGPPVLSWCEPKPIWDSISCLPALSTLKNHNNTELRQKFWTHYSLPRSRPRSKSSPSPSLSHDVFSKNTLLL